LCSGGTSIEYHFVGGIGYDKNGSYFKNPNNGSIQVYTGLIELPTTKTSILRGYPIQ
jgi:hypothetical protein